MAIDRDRDALSLRDVVRFVVQWCVGMAQRKGWGELKISVQAGHIMVVHEHRTHRHGLPGEEPEIAAEAERQLTAVAREPAA